MRIEFKIERNVEWRSMRAMVQLVGWVGGRCGTRVQISPRPQFSGNTEISLSSSQHHYFLYSSKSIPDFPNLLIPSQTIFKGLYSKFQHLLFIIIYHGFNGLFLKQVDKLEIINYKKVFALNSFGKILSLV